MKICLICLDKYSFFIDSANYLSDDGYEVHVFCSKEISNLNKGVYFHDDLVGKIDAEKSKLNVFTLPINAKKFKKKLNKINPHILHAFNLKWSGWISAMSSVHPFILSGMGSDILKEQKAESNFVLKYLKQYTIHRADYITVVSSQMAEQVRVVNTDVAIDYFAPGADPDKFQPGKPKNGFADKFNIEENTVIFSPRGIRPIYQTQEIIKAFALLRKNNPDILLISGGSEQTEYAEETKKLVKDLNLNDSVYFTGRANSEEWLDYYRVADIVVSFPYNDGMPATIFEAMAMGKPLVLSNIPSTNEICTDNYDAIVCKRNDVDSLVKALEKILTDETLKTKVIRNAKTTFMKKGNARTYIKNIENVYRKLAG